MVPRSSSATVVDNAAPTEALKIAQPRRVLNRPCGGDSSRLSQKRGYVAGHDFARAFPSSAMPHTECQSEPKI